jgi:two-component system nitrate/nitrite sensor histidine kinase NarX
MLQHDARSRTDDAGFPHVTGAACADAASGTCAADPPPADRRPADLPDALGPMLEAVVRLAGATAASVRLVGADGAAGVRVASVGAAGMSPSTPWCAVCDDGHDQASECVLSHVRGRADAAVASAVTQVCRHIAVVPLEHRGKPVGTLALLFAAPFRLAPEMTPLLKAVGDLLGVALENARLARENLRVTLMNERQMMANEVHDSLAQALTYMRMRMSLLSDAIRQHDELRAFKYWSDVDDSLTQAHRRLRELITSFRSRMDPQGLVHALSEIAARFFDRTGVTLAFDNRAPGFGLPADREVEVFHIVQEALANVCRHAQARRVDLTLAPTDGGYEIAIVDDGVGVRTSAGPVDTDDGGHYGLAIMRERACRLGGSLTVERAPGAGTCVRLTIPAETPRDETRL